MTPDAAVAVQLKELRAGGGDRDRGRVVVEHLPARAGLAAARRAGVTPDRAGVMQLIEGSRVQLEELPAGGDHAAARVVVEPLPARTTVAAARRPRMAPDPAVVVQLIEVAARRGDRRRLAVVVEPLPARATAAAARRPRETPDPTVVVQLVELSAARGDGDGLGIIVEHLPARAGVAA